MPSPTAPAVAELVRALALAWKNLAAYPPGHPALAGSVEQVHHQLRLLRGPAGDVVFGISSDALIYGEEKIEWPQAQKFAHALYTRGVAIVRFGPGTDPRELEIFLRLLGTPASQHDSPIWEELTRQGVSNINLQPVDYSAVQITSDLSIEPPKREYASLWEDILKALLSGKDITANARQLLSSIRSVDQLAALIMRHVNDAGSDAAFDPDATFGVRILARPNADTPEAATSRVSEAIGTHIATSTGLKRQLALQQVVQLLKGLPPSLRESVIRSVLDTLARDEAAGSHLREFTSELKPDEVLEALRYLSSAGALSSHATRLLETLAMTRGPSHESQPASPALIAELVELFGDEDLDRFNPPDHLSLLEDVSITIPLSRPVSPDAIAGLRERVDTVADDVVNLQVARSLMELVARYGSDRNPDALLRRVEGVFEAQVTSAQFGEALELVQRLREIAATSGGDSLGAAIQQSLARLGSADVMNAIVDGLLAAAPEKTATIQWLIDALGTAALQSLLIALAEESNRSRRRKLFDFVSGLGERIVPDVTRYLSDERWYVVRNMIVLLRGVNDRSALGEIRRLAQHPDLRVRLEAIKSLLVLDPTVPRSLLENAINDPDPKMAEAAIALVGSYAIREGVDPLVQVISGRDIFGRRRSLRIRAIKSLGELGAPEALPGVEPFLRESFLPWPHRAERRAAWESLASYPPEARAPYVERGLRSRDAAVREMCRRLRVR